MFAFTILKLIGKAFVLKYIALLLDLCYDHWVDSTDLTAQCSRFLFLSVHGPKISTTLERIAQIYLPYLPLFASLDDDDNDDDDDHLEWRADC